MTFRIEFFVEDKSLATVLRAVSGVAMDLKSVPVVNATVTNGKLTAETGGTMIELFAQSLIDKPSGTIITPEGIRQFCSSIGRSPASWRSVCVQAAEAGLIKSKMKGQYVIVHVRKGSKK